MFLWCLATPTRLREIFFGYISANGSDWSVERTRQLSGSSAPDLVTLQPRGKGVGISSPKPFALTFDSAEPVVKKEEKDEEGEVFQLAKWLSITYVKQGSYAVWKSLNSLEFHKSHFQTLKSLEISQNN
jgi:hypothetical protein